MTDTSTLYRPHRRAPVQAETGNARTQGFTIIELLVATLVFSLVLLLITAGVLQIARLYYKGITEANTQNTARSIMDTISQSIQFGGGAVTETPASSGDNSAGTDYAFCVGNVQYSYRPGWQVEDGTTSPLHQSWHGLVQATVSGCSSATSPQTLSNQAITGRELINPHMRLADLSVTNIGTNLYKIQIRVAYGDDDLLASTNGPTATDVICQNTLAGTQFCAVSELSTIVVKRVE